MAHDRSEVHLAADFSAQPAHALESSAFRVAIFGNFSGRSGENASRPFTGRRPWRVDRDDLDSVMARIAPELRITLDPSEAPVAVAFSSLEHFHPDQLLKRLPLFQRLVALRNEAASAPAPAQSAPLRRGQQPDAVALDLAGGSLLDQIVGGTPAPAGAPSSAPRDDLAEFVSRAVRSHTVAETTPQQRDVAAKVDEVIVATMRVVLHSPQFQALESLWRGVDFLVRRLDTSETMQVYLVDVTREELVAELSTVDSAQLRQVPMQAPGGQQGEQAWSVVVGAYTFEPADAQLLSRLAALGRMSGAPWVAGAHPKFMGVESFAGTDSDDWTPDRSAAWGELRASSSASFLSLSSPRFLARLPYGRRGETCDTFSFEELSGAAPAHESFLWANPAFACALAIADGVVADGEPGSHARIEGLPLYVAPVNGEPTATPCTEATLTQSAVEELLDAGLTALASPRDGDTILIARIQSVAAPPRRLSIRPPTV